MDKELSYQKYDPAWGAEPIPPVPDESLVDMFRRTVSRFPDKPAAIFLEREETAHRERVTKHLVVLKRRADQSRARVYVAELNLRAIAEFGYDCVDVAAALLERLEIVDQKRQLIARDATGEVR